MDQLVGDVGAVVLSGVDVVDAQLDGPTEHGQGRGPVTRRTRYAWTGELHRAEANARHEMPGEDVRAARWINSLVDGGHVFVPLITIRFRLSTLRAGRTTISPGSLSAAMSSRAHARGHGGHG